MLSTTPRRNTVHLGVDDNMANASGRSRNVFLPACPAGRFRLRRFRTEQRRRLPIQLLVVHAREARRPAHPAGGRQRKLRPEAGLVKEAIQAYLASVTFADACIGRVLDALERSPFKDNTIVVLWSDNGYQFGEKSHWEKVALWRPSNHVVFQVIAPGVTQPGSRCDDPVSLMDIYPTLVSLAGLPPKDGIAGIDLTPTLQKPGTQKLPPALATLGRGNHSVFSDRWVYIRYRDGSEELYDLQEDPYEWKNLAGNPEWADVKKELGEYMPATNAEPLKVKNY
jgi:arylsulfatase A-like enzyme